MPRWRFARCLESERPDDRPGHGGIVYALHSFTEETEAILTNRENFVTSIIGGWVVGRWMLLRFVTSLDVLCFGLNL